MTSNGKIIVTGELERKQTQLILRCCLCIYVEKLKKTTKNLIQFSLSAGLTFEIVTPPPDITNTKQECQPLAHDHR